MHCTSKGTNYGLHSNAYFRDANLAPMRLYFILYSIVLKRRVVKKSFFCATSHKVIIRLDHKISQTSQVWMLVFRMVYYRKYLISDKKKVYMYIYLHSDVRHGLD